MFLHGDVSVSELPAAGRGRPAPATCCTCPDGRPRSPSTACCPGRPARSCWPPGATPDPEGGSTAIGVLGWSGLVEGWCPVTGSCSAPAAPSAASTAADGTTRRCRPRRGSSDAGQPAGTTAAAHPEPAATPPGSTALGRTPTRRPPVRHPVAAAGRPVTRRRPAAAARRSSRPRATARRHRRTCHRPQLRRPRRRSARSRHRPPPPGAPPPKLRPPRVSEQIHGSHVHEARRPPLPIAGAKPPAPRPGPPAQARRTSWSRASAAPGTTTTTPGCRSARSAASGWISAPAILVDGRRPPLGLLVLDIGSTFVLDDNYLLGRNPEVDEAVIRSRLRPIRLDDDSGTLSRVHAEIRLEGWDVLLIDRGSANGTYIAGQRASRAGTGWRRNSPSCSPPEPTSGPGAGCSPSNRRTRGCERRRTGGCSRPSVRGRCQPGQS